MAVLPQVGPQVHSGHLTEAPAASLPAAGRFHSQLCMTFTLCDLPPSWHSLWPPKHLVQASTHQDRCCGCDTVTDRCSLLLSSTGLLPCPRPPDTSSGGREDISLLTTLAHVNCANIARLEK
ncbi:uncharacterized protein LOC135102270 isoform X2 [Scylla paramamosain]|uniref:uncharacterized protein LOC135102270 isoform X2 n=2 Tax=Scylla paramamosain TaxID=85552 RepID=UPI003083D731